MNRFGSSFVVSVLLHVGLFLLAYISWMSAPKPSPVSSVPIEIVSKIPSREQMETPVDKLAVKTPVPEPAPEEQPKPEVKPEPAPKLPVPVPQKAVVKPEPVKPQPKPEPPKPVVKTPPDKNGLKKPEPPKATKPALDLDALSQIAASPSKSRTKTLPQANTRPTNGASNNGAAKDAGTQTALTALTSRLTKLWSPNCDVPGANLVNPEIQFTISPNGRVVRGPEWVNRRNDPVWEAAASRAMSAVKRGELYEGLPDGLYNRELAIEFKGESACAN